MRRPIDLNADFDALLLNLESKAKNVCRLGGGGWPDRLAWNPQASFKVDNDESFSEQKLNDFIARQQSKGRLVIGFLNYELGYQLHDLNMRKNDRKKLPLAMFYAYENYLEKTGGKTVVYTKDKSFVKYVKSIDRPAEKANIGELRFKPLWPKDDYTQAFSKIKNYIYDGVIYQINLTQELAARYSGESRTLYVGLSGANTAQMKAYLENEDFEIISMSPERFIKTSGKDIETSPIKGTRPRGKNEEEDKKNEAALLNDEKEKAELNMITDLLRNDLGKICAAGSVNVIKNRQIDKLTSVIHTFSTIAGKLQEDIRPIEALLSMFPGGSITGCPKRKAMEIIDELEQSGRGIYCGNLVVVEPDGNLDSNILIRTIIKRGGELSLSVGSGIVYDSDLAKEYQENLDKSASFLAAGQKLT